MRRISIVVILAMSILCGSREGSTRGNVPAPGEGDVTERSEMLLSEFTEVMRHYQEAYEEFLKEYGSGSSVGEMYSSSTPDPDEELVGLRDYDAYRGGCRHMFTWDSPLQSVPLSFVGDSWIQWRDWEMPEPWYLILP